MPEMVLPGVVRILFWEQSCVGNTEFGFKRGGQERKASKQQFLLIVEENPQSK